MKTVNADLISVNIAPGDSLLVCSDGLSNYFETEEFGQLVRDHYSDELPQKVAELALERGGEDNITVIVVSVTNGADIRLSSKPPEATSRAVGADTLPPV